MTDHGTVNMRATSVSAGPATTAPQSQEPSSGKSLFDELIEAANAAVAVPTIDVPVEHRPGWAVRYRINLSREEIANWRGATTDSARLDRFILANSCEGFLKDRKLAVDSTGQPLTFGTIASEQKITVAEAVLLWLVTPGVVSGTSDLVYLRSGYRMPEVMGPDADPM